MAPVERTAYPRFRRFMSARELHVFYTPTAEADAAAELRRQEWFDLEDEADPEAAAAWKGALGGLKSAASTFEWIAAGWI